MKKIFYTFILIGYLFYILAFPQDSVKAASIGLNLWYETMLPTLLPFSILSYILIHSGMLDSFAQQIHKFFKHLFPVSSAGIYPLAAGLLFGFPMGSKITAELVQSGKMTPEEGQRLFCVCNNISPLFVSSFILNESLQKPKLRLASYLILYAPPLIVYMFWNHRKTFRTPMEGGALSKKTASMNFQLIDAGIMNGFETLAKLGGYIILFAILAQMSTLLPIGNPIIKCLLIGVTEITNGIAYTAKQGFAFQLAYPLMMAYTAFGGISGFAQTASMVKDAGFSMLPYLQIKLLCTALSFGLALFLAYAGFPLCR